METNVPASLETGASHTDRQTMLLMRATVPLEPTRTHSKKERERRCAIVTVRAGIELGFAFASPNGPLLSSLSSTDIPPTVLTTNFPYEVVKQRERQSDASSTRRARESGPEADAQHEHDWGSLRERHADLPAPPAPRKLPLVDGDMPSRVLDGHAKPTPPYLPLHQEQAIHDFLDRLLTKCAGRTFAILWRP
jgi:hypothetical protein